jgi:endonuclease/exonuclease/phosphatase family metal-dependent hydrolase
MRGLRFVVSTVALLFVSIAPAAAQQAVRVASYNIKFLSTNVSSQGDRLAKLQQVIARLDADVIGLQEIADRAALELLFPPAQWDIFIDDESNDAQDVAIVVRRPLKIKAPDLNADDEDFLFAGASNENLFPNRRDLLVAEIAIPNMTSTLFVMVHHAKSRLGGRAVTDPRREGAAAAILQVLEQRFDERDFVLLGDFNDNPDDRSLNILETGNPTASGGPEEQDGPFLMNLMEQLVAADHVSHGRNALDIGEDNINTIDPGSRLRNNVNRGNNTHTGDILFDQLLIPMRMKDRYVAGSAAIFDDPVALEGGNATQASDHLAVFADFSLGDVPSEPGDGVRIASLLPNPIGEDAGREQITIANGTNGALSLAGWTLRDRGQNVFTLSGTIAASSSLTVTLSPNTMPLNNSGDEVFLIDKSGMNRHKISYEAGQVQSGVVIVIP